MSKYDTPELPPDHYFRVYRIHHPRYGSVYAMTLARKRKWWIDKQLYHDTYVVSGNAATDIVRHMIHKSMYELASKLKAEKFIGDYPPKKL